MIALDLSGDTTVYDEIVLPEAHKDMTFLLFAALCKYDIVVFSGPFNRGNPTQAT